MLMIEFSGVRCSCDMVVVNICWYYCSRASFSIEST